MDELLTQNLLAAKCRIELYDMSSSSLKTTDCKLKIVVFTTEMDPNYRLHKAGSFGERLKAVDTQRHKSLQI